MNKQKKHSKISSNMWSGISITKLARLGGFLMLVTFCPMKSLAQVPDLTVDMTGKPSVLSDGSLKLWLDADHSDSIIKDGSNKVSKWKDLSGDGGDFSA